MKIVITQPNFLPWLGYFSQLNSCDLWVSLDDVQYSRREWQNRNRILDLSSNAVFLSVPIQKAPRASRISQILLSDSYQPFQHLEKIKMYYLNSPFFKTVFPFVENVFQISFKNSEGYLSHFNVQIISQVCKNFGIDCNIEFSSNLPEFKGQSATQRLFQIAQYFNASSYLSSAGARDYMHSELSLFKDASIEVLWQDFVHEPYVQHLNQGDFVSHLSFIDYLFNCGFDNLGSYLTKCHHESVSFPGDIGFATQH